MQRPAAECSPIYLICSQLANGHSNGGRLARGVLHDDLLLSAAKEMLGNGPGGRSVVEDVSDPQRGNRALGGLRLLKTGLRGHRRQQREPPSPLWHPVFQASRTDLRRLSGTRYCEQRNLVQGSSLLSKQDSTMANSTG